jgi:hypothetical protein
MNRISDPTNPVDPVILSEKGDGRMKRDVHLVRDLLLKIEAEKEPDCGDEAVLYHTNLLHEVHLVEGD